MAQLADREVFQHLAHRRDVGVERRRIPVEVDEHETGEHDTVNLAQADIAVLQLAATELLTFQHELIVAVQVPAPAVERADDVPVLESDRKSGRVGKERVSTCRARWAQYH